MAKILVVDDSHLSRRILRSILETAGYDVVEASDGSEALDRYPLDQPDLVLLDQVMPGLSGLEVLPKLIELDANVRVVMATADVQTSTLELTKAAGAFDMVNKPYQVEELLNAVRKALIRPKPLHQGAPT
jgi:two-component system, chemotaxis family, chemotaxis protein CheY